MSLLRFGITGFNAHDTVDFRAFKRAVYSAAQATGASVVSTEAADSVTPNFHQADILLGDRELCVICNRTFPVVAFVKRPIEMSGVQPIDVPELADAIATLGFEVASAAELQRPLEKNDLDILSKVERHEANYWKPKRVSQVVFHWWD